MSYQDVWLHHPGIRSIFTRLINMTDALPVEERKRPAQFRVTPKTVPMLWSPSEPGEDAYLWRLIHRLDQEGYVRLRLGKPVPGQAEYESKPMLVLNPERETEIREIIGRPERPGEDVARWRQALQVHAHRFPGSIEKLAAAPIRIPGKSHGEIVERLALLPTIPTNLYLREASARLFWGLSKVLDNREEALAELMGVQVCPLPAKPVVLHVHLPRFANSVLFIENETTYLAALAGRYKAFSGLHGPAFVYAAGFKSSAERLRNHNGSVIHYSEMTNCPDSNKSAFRSWLENDSALLQPYFWGDLDFSGMGILKALRARYRNVRAWEPGYTPMLEAVQRGEGHAVEEGDKSGQIDPGETGCPYADSVLLPSLRTTGLLVDQEAVNFDI